MKQVRLTMKPISPSQRRSIALDDLFEQAVDMAVHTFEEFGSVPLMWLCEGQGPENQGLPQDKAERQAAIRSAFRQMRVVRYALMAEAWWLDAVDGEFPESIKCGASLASHPRRREVVAISAEDKQQRQRAGFFEILRPEHGKPALGPFQRTPEENRYTGRMWGLLADYGA
jgi:hypothetical protein